jgi:hypothetical protein
MDLSSASFSLLFRRIRKAFFPAIFPSLFFGRREAHRMQRRRSTVSSYRTTFRGADIRGRVLSDAFGKWVFVSEWGFEGDGLGIPIWGKSSETLFTFGKIWHHYALLLIICKLYRVQIPYE